jgi:hypothetical protein
MTDTRALPGDSRSAGISERQVRLLVNEARAVVQKIEQLPEHANISTDLTWAEFRAQIIRQHWEQLVEVMYSGRAESFTGALRTIMSNYVPLLDAPRALLDFVRTIEELDDSLADNFGAIIDPLIRGRRLMPEVLDQLREILPRLAPEFGG